MVEDEVEAHLRRGELTLVNDCPGGEGCKEDVLVTEAHLGTDLVLDNLPEDEELHGQTHVNIGS